MRPVETVTNAGDVVAVAGMVKVKVFVTWKAGMGRSIMPEKVGHRNIARFCADGDNRAQLAFGMIQNDTLVKRDTPKSGAKRPPIVFPANVA